MIDLAEIVASCPGAKLLWNSLEESPSVGDLDQDLVFVKLPDGLMIDVSWYPEGDPTGAYHVSVIRGRDWDHPLNEWETKSSSHAAEIVAFEVIRNTKRK